MIECKVFEEETGIFDLFIGLCGTITSTARDVTSTLLAQ